MISDYLSTGKDNAICCKDLAKITSMPERDITEAVMRERRSGLPICATSDSRRPGYYMAADKEEMQDFCQSLARREKEIRETRKSCLKTITGLPSRGE